MKVAQKALATEKAQVEADWQQLLQERWRLQEDRAQVQQGGEEETNCGGKRGGVQFEDENAFLNHQPRGWVEQDERG